LSQSWARVPAPERFAADDRAGTPAKIVCTALALAVLVLVFRIATIW
jgi:hypothetical protein